MRPTAAIRTAARTTLAEPALWPIALAGFLVRGGIVLMLLSLVPFPSAVGLANLVGPTAVTAAGPTSATIVEIFVLTAIGIAVLIAAIVIGAALEVELVGGLLPGSLAGRRAIRRVIAIRLVSLVPVAILIAAAAPSIGATVYRELLTPSDIAVSLVERVARGSVGQLVAIAAAWLAAETLGGVAVRIALADDARTLRSLGLAVAWVVRNPARTLAALGLGAAGILAALIPSLVALAGAMAGLRDLVESGAAAPFVALAIVLLVAVWSIGLVLLGIAATWRSCLWTAAVAGGLRDGAERAVA